MDGVDIGDFGGANDAIGAKIAVGAFGPANADGLISQLNMERLDIGLGIDGQSLDAQFTTCPDDAEGDFAAIGDEDLLNHFWKREIHPTTPDAPDAGIGRGRMGTGSVVRLALFDLKEALTVFDGLPVFDKEFQDGTLGFRLDFVHDLHGLDDADHGVFDDFGANIGERLALR